MSVEDVRDSLPKTTSPIKAIRHKCLDCCAGSYTEVEKCPAKKCPLWHFRFGKNPFRKPVSEERRAAAAERFRKYREKISGDGQDE